MMDGCNGGHGNITGDSDDECRETSPFIVIFCV